MRSLTYVVNRAKVDKNRMYVNEKHSTWGANPTSYMYERQVRKSQQMS